MPVARTVQFPADQGEVAVVMRGGRGVGKGILGHALRKLFGQHGMYISKSKHLVGAFNAHLRDCALLFADEAFFAGDKSAEGTLKSLITEEILIIEPKGQNVILSKNHLHVVMASNEDWVVPVDKTVAAAQLRGKILDAHFHGNRYLIKYLDENGRVKVIEIHTSAVGGDVRCNHGRWRFPPEIVLPERD